MRMHKSSYLVALALVLVACGNGAVTTTEGTTQSDAATSTTTSVSPARTPGDSTVHLADSDFGQILVDPEGFTLYVFTNDNPGQSTCNDACADIWPPVPADTPIGAGLDETMFGSVARSDGSEQLAVDDMPLYRYAPDGSPGDVKGQGVNGVWFVVGADGARIEADSPDDTAVRFDY